MKVKKFDSDFDQGRDVTEMLDLSKARRPQLKARRVDLEIPTWMVDKLDEEATRLGVTRQSIIRMRLAERLERSASD